MPSISLNQHPELKKENKIFFSLKLAKKIVFSLIFVIVFEFFLFPIPALASEYTEVSNISDNNQITENLEIINNGNLGEEVKKDKVEIINSLPENKDIEITRTSYHTITAYNSEVSQCDGSPCITANGFNLCEHGMEDSVAANFLKFGTKIKIPELFGDRVFVVRDRMNKKHPDKIDIWMLKKEDAKQFGVRIAKIEVLEEP